MEWNSHAGTEMHLRSELLAFRGFVSKKREKDAQPGKKPNRKPPQKAMHHLRCREAADVGGVHRKS